ncbi:MAG: hypothetical protein KC561_02440, partial [Myxococcales bacterium]|nr:hypothetical protein [Myxococcales bacterium]
MSQSAISKMMSEKSRMLQLMCIAAFAGLTILNFFLKGKLFTALWVLTAGAVFFASLAPAIGLLINGDSDSIGRSGHLGLKAGEAAGLAVVAITVLLVLGCIKYIIVGSSV